MLPTEIEVVDFLTEMFNNGQGYSAINSTRFALSAVIIGKSGISIGKFESVKRLLKGVFELRPPAPKYEFILDANIVLDFSINFDVNDVTLSFLPH